MADDARVTRLRTQPLPANISDGKADGNGEASVAEVRALDRGLVRRAQEGDREAFGQLYRTHHAAVYRFARFSLRTDADDATAETFVRAWAALDRYRDTGAPFVAWLFGIARHVVADELRRRGRTEPRDELPDRPLPARSLEDDMDLSAAIDRLPEEQRIVIELKYLAGMTNPEVAALLDTTVGAVNAKQWRALRALNEMLSER